MWKGFCTRVAPYPPGVLYSFTRGELVVSGKGQQAPGGSLGKMSLDSTYGVRLCFLLTGHTQIFRATAGHTWPPNLHQ